MICVEPGGFRRARFPQKSATGVNPSTSPAQPCLIVFPGFVLTWQHPISRPRTTRGAVVSSSKFYGRRRRRVATCDKWTRADVLFHPLSFWFMYSASLTHLKIGSPWNIWADPNFDGCTQTFRNGTFHRMEILWMFEHFFFGSSVLRVTNS